MVMIGDSVVLAPGPVDVSVAGASLMPYWLQALVMAVLLLASFVFSLVVGHAVSRCSRPLGAVAGVFVTLVLVMGMAPLYVSTAERIGPGALDALGLLVFVSCGVVLLMAVPVFLLLALALGVLLAYLAHGVFRVLRAAVARVRAGDGDDRGSRRAAGNGDSVPVQPGPDGRHGQADAGTGPVDAFVE